MLKNIIGGVLMIGLLIGMAASSYGADSNNDDAFIILIVVIN